MGKQAALLLLLLTLAACAAPVTSPTITLIADGETRTLGTNALTVRELLSEAGITVGEDDRVMPVESTFIQDGMTIRVIRVEYRTETEQRDIPFERRTVREASIPAGEIRLLDPGITGIEELVYRITIEDGIEIERQFVHRAVRQEPRTEVVLIGVQAELKPVPVTGIIAYIANGNAWVIQSTSLNQRRLTHAGDLDGRVFALSPDGAYLLFTRVAAPSVSVEAEVEVTATVGITTTITPTSTVSTETEDEGLPTPGVTATVRATSTISPLAEHERSATPRRPTASRATTPTAASAATSTATRAATPTATPSRGPPSPRHVPRVPPGPPTRPTARSKLADRRR